MAETTAGIPAVSAEENSTLRQRKGHATSTGPASEGLLTENEQSLDDDKNESEEEVTWGKTPSGVGELLLRFGYPPS